MLRALCRPRSLKITSTTMLVLGIVTMLSLPTGGAAAVRVRQTNRPATAALVRAADVTQTPIAAASAVVASAVVVDRVAGSAPARFTPRAMVAR
ncbi:MAG: hypothetical protein M3N98_00960, partial [Actinomycetota bacterium]|nr:hypothetical protein [Actinomycetota bacterium]